MKPLLLHGFGISLHVNGRTLGIDWYSEGRKESYRPQQLPFDSVVVDSLTGSVSLEALRFLAIHDVPVTLLRWNGTVLSIVRPRGPSNGELRVAQVEGYADPDRRLKIAHEFIREKVAKTASLAEHLSKTLPATRRFYGSWRGGLSSTRTAACTHSRPNPHCSYRQCNGQRARPERSTSAPRVTRRRRCSQKRDGDLFRRPDGHRPAPPPEKCPIADDRAELPCRRFGCE